MLRQWRCIDGPECCHTPCAVQFVHFKLYHGLGLAYPPMLDPKLEQAAAGLAAIMRDLAGMRDTVEGQQQQQRQQQLQQGQQGEQGQQQNGGAEDGAADAADVVQRLGTLAKRIRQIEAEQASTAGPAAAADAAEAGSEDEDEDAALEIDSGDDEASEEEGEEGEADSEDGDDEEGVSDDDDMQEEEEQEVGQDGTNLELSASERAGEQQCSCTVAVGPGLGALLLGGLHAGSILERAGDAHSYFLVWARALTQHSKLLHRLPVLYLVLAHHQPSALV